MLYPLGYRHFGFLGIRWRRETVPRETVPEVAGSKTLTADQAFARNQGLAVGRRRPGCSGWGDRQAFTSMRPRRRPTGPPRCDHCLKLWPKTTTAMLIPIAPASASRAFLRLPIIMFLASPVASSTFWSTECYSAISICPEILQRTWPSTRCCPCPSISRPDRSVPPCRLVGSGWLGF
jgi:hypothetical protein